MRSSDTVHQQAGEGRAGEGDGPGIEIHHEARAGCGSQPERGYVMKDGIGAGDSSDGHGERRYGAAGTMGTP